jgi:acetolactate synthase-1/2/3 large subunit
MIRHFQELYLESNYVQTKRQTGYVVPDFGAISRAYGIPYVRVEGLSCLDVIKPYLSNDEPGFIEISLKEDTYVFPKLAMGKLNQDQEPELDRELFGYISNL